MGLGVCTGSMLQCSFGVAPSSLIVLPQNKTMTCNMPAATITDNKPIVNIPPFAMCTCQANPAVIAATAAAMGTPTPAPCMPVITAPWAPGSTKTMIGNTPAVVANSKLTCMWGGVISINKPGANTVQIT